MHISNVVIISTPLLDRFHLQIEYLWVCAKFKFCAFAENILCADYSYLFAFFQSIVLLALLLR